VNRAGTDYNQQAVVLSGQDPVDGLARVRDSFRGCIGHSDICYELFGGYQLVGLAYPQVVCGGTHWLFRYVATGEDFPAGQKAANIPSLPAFWQPGRESGAHARREVPASRLTDRGPN
jgi:hypothetical protein